MSRKKILSYIGKRIIVYVISLFVSFTILFFFLRLIPGDPITRYVIMLEQRYSYSTGMLDIVKQWKAKLGLEGDMLAQYAHYLQNVFLHFDLGPSFVAFPTPVQELVLKRLPWTIGLLGVAVLISWSIGIIAGTLIGWKKDTKLDFMLTPIALCMSQIPYYILAILLVLLLSYIFPIFPSRYAFSPGVQIEFDLKFISNVIYHSFLPALSLVLTSAFGWFISSRFLTVTILGEDYLLFAQAKGLKASRIFNRYVLRNTLLPQATGLAMSLGFIVNGAYLVEWIFQYPGIGGLLQYAILLVDYNTIQGIILMSIFTVLTANLIMDLIYPLIDPRIRSG